MKKEKNQKEYDLEHMPYFIKDAPWYMGKETETKEKELFHQRIDESKQKHSTLNTWYKKGLVNSNQATKFRKGACTNCGSITHSVKDCVERPRKIGA